jgi:hypothetical protein
MLPLSGFGNQLVLRFGYLELVESLQQIGELLLQLVEHRILLVLDQRHLFHFLNFPQVLQLTLVLDPPYPVDLAQVALLGPFEGLVRYGKLFL